MIWNDFYELSCLFLEHNDEANKKQTVQDSTQSQYICTNDTRAACVGFYLTWYENSGSLTFYREAFLFWSAMENVT